LLVRRLSSRTVVHNPSTIWIALRLKWVILKSDRPLLGGRLYDRPATRPGQKRQQSRYISIIVVASDHVTDSLDHRRIQPWLHIAKGGNLLGGRERTVLGMHDEDRQIQFGGGFAEEATLPAAPQTIIIHQPRIPSEIQSTVGSGAKVAPQTIEPPDRHRCSAQTAIIAPASSMFEKPNAASRKVLRIKSPCCSSIHGVTSARARA